MSFLVAVLAHSVCRNIEAVVRQMYTLEMYGTQITTQARQANQW
jgi:hypothetical protein